MGNKNLGMGQSKLPDCLECGACCRRPWAVEVASEEKARIPAEMVFTSPSVGRHNMKYDDELRACVALDTKTNKCTIYENRPYVCRSVKRWDQWCLKAFRNDYPGRKSTHKRKSAGWWDEEVL